MIITSRLSPGWRLWLGMLITVLLGVTISVLVSVRMADNSLKEQVRRQEALRSEGRGATCDLVARILAGYAESPPPSVTGKNVVEAWREEYHILQCPIN